MNQTKMMYLKMKREMPEISAEAKRWIDQSPVYLDTETTGLGNRDEIFQIAIVDDDGRVLIDTLVNPTIGIPLSATAIHGIGDKEIAGAPAWPQIRKRVLGLLRGRQLLIYNAAYDIRMIIQTGRAHQISEWVRDVCPDIACVMLEYAEYFGEWNDYRQDYKWQKLEIACQQQGIDTSDITAHHAAADCEMTRRLVHRMASGAGVTA